MKINLTKNDAKFIVNEKKHKVVCIFDNTSRLFIQYAEKNLRIKPDCDGMLWNKSSLYEKLIMPKRFVGIATCDPNDEFSVETGKLIAYSRAKDKIHNSFFKRANTYINTLDDWLNQAAESINRYGDKISINTDRRHQKIIDLIGEPEEK